MTDQTNIPDNSDNVLSFTKRFDENADIREMRNLVDAEPTKVNRCTHSKILVDSHQRQLTCRQCGAVVDALTGSIQSQRKRQKLIGNFADYAVK